MYTVGDASTPLAVGEAYRVFGTVVAAMAAGWVAERTVDTGWKVRGLVPVVGLLGLYVGRLLLSWGGWSAGPAVADFPIAPALAGAFAVCAVLKLVGLGAAGPRW